MRALTGKSSGCWSFRETGYSFLVALVKKEAKGKKLDPRIFLIPLFPVSSFFSYLVLGSEPGGKNPQSSKGQLQNLI